MNTQKMSDILKYRGFFIQPRQKISQRSVSWYVSVSKSIIVNGKEKKLKAEAKAITEEEAKQKIEEKIDALIDQYPQAES